MLDPLLLNTPAVAVERSQLLINEMEALAIDGFRKAISTLQIHDEAIYDEVANMEKTVDKYEDKLGTYLVQLSGQDLTVADSHEISKMLHIIGDFERISDYSVAVSKVSKEMSDKCIEFSSEANREISVLREAMTELLTITKQSFEENNAALALQVEPLQQLIYELIHEVKNRHIERLKNKNCTIELGFVLSDLLNSYERAAGHCSNIAVAVIEAMRDSFAPHEYLRNYRKDEKSSYKEILQLQKEKYVL